MPDRIEVVKRFAMRGNLGTAIGWIRTAKNSGWMGLQAVVTGTLLAWGWPEAVAVVVGAVVSAAINALREYVREDKIVKTEI